jgi:hypothetical protein
MGVNSPRDSRSGTKRPTFFHGRQHSKEHAMDISFRRRVMVTILLTMATLVLSRDAIAQSSTTYYLHDENGSNYGTFALEAIPPDTVTVVRQTNDFRKSNGPLLSQLIGAWSTLVGVPGTSGTIPAGSVVTFTLWMRKTSSYGIVYPYASLATVESLDVNLQPKAFICSATGGDALDTALRAYTFSCVNTQAIPMDVSDRLVLFAGYSITLMPGNKSMMVELDFEGATDSRVVAPDPM